MKRPNLSPRPFRALAARFVAALVLTAAAALPAAAQEHGRIEVGSGVSYQAIGRWDTARLDSVASTEAPTFFGIDSAAPPARNAVKLYRVTYPSVVPERGNRPIVATGLLAIPDTDATRFPLLSYQHGTVYGKQQVPSFPDQSPETALALARFAAQGYIVIGADYFGMGSSTEPEGYLVKESHQQATFDMISASRAVLAHLKLTAGKLVLGGWSQGGFVTMALLEKLESAGVKVAGAATASAPVDGFLCLNGFLFFPRANDANWVNSLFVLTAFSFENYYGVPGLARSLLTTEAYEAGRKIYEREPVEAADLPTDLHKLIQPDYFDPQFFAASAYGRILKERTNAYRWVITTPVRNYYGEDDEVIATDFGKLAASYQHAMGAGNSRVEAISTGKTNHRGTYATAIPEWKAWFDSLPDD
ncbi:lipase family protein [Ancylobacter sp. A5.8]|uniref:alpha/beta hydrolase family protein n=1 Tax=Ancylobacter gelatini TaxID=2919920 RepID=UPI001F4D3940|nr:alpha/beta fold hydrolase [Ancylobacter gelatini]MCJ8143154.1 lipase family protein [Ancylobacter gelatini]